MDLLFSVLGFQCFCMAELAWVAAFLYPMGICKTRGPCTALLASCVYFGWLKFQKKSNFWVWGCVSFGRICSSIHEALGLPGTTKQIVVTHTYNLSIQEEKAGGSEAQGHSWLYIISSRPPWDTWDPREGGGEEGRMGGKTEFLSSFMFFGEPLF